MVSGPGLNDEKKTVVLRLEKELGLKASLVEVLRRDLEGVGAELRTEQARSRQLAVENQRLRVSAGQRDRQPQGGYPSANHQAINPNHPGPCVHHI